MPTDLFLKPSNTLHPVLLKVSGGHLGWTAGSMPVFQLTTTGRRSGELRSVMLTSPYRDGETMLIVASRGADDNHPAWFLNLCDDPTVQVETEGRPKRTMTARVVDADERAALWPLVVEKYATYADDQGRTDRQIPLVLLEP